MSEADLHALGHGEPLRGLIRSHPSFSGLDDETIRRLVADSRVTPFVGEEILLRQGDASDYALLLLDGTVAVVAQTEFGVLTLSELSGVQLLGDVGVYAQLPRSATVLARTDGCALRIERAVMMRLCYHDPGIPLHVIQHLGARLNAFNQAIATYADALSALDSEHGSPGIVGALLNPPPELTNFAGAFRKMAQFINQQRQQREEMASAAAIQTALLPFPLPVDPQGRFHLNAVIKPARHVGGDFFDALYDGADTVVVTIGDVSGKGVPASLFATVCQMVMRLVLADEDDLGVSLARANELITSANREGMFATFFAARLNLATGELQFCNAGHVTPIVQRANGACEFLTAHDLPLAVLDEATYTEQRMHLSRGDRLVLCTDGVIEALDAAGEEFGQDRLTSTIMALHERGGDRAAALVAAVEAFSVDTEQFDDIACVALLRNA